MHAVPNTSAAQTDVSAFITDLDGGQFDRMLSVALGQVAAGVVDNNKVGEVAVKFTIERIPGTHQVNVKHSLKFSKNPRWTARPVKKPPAKPSCTWAKTA